MNISLSDALKEFVDQQVSAAGYGSSSEYVCELIRRDQEWPFDRLRANGLRDLLLEGAQSKSFGLADADYFASLRSDIKKRLAKPRLRPLICHKHCGFVVIDPTVLHRTAHSIRGCNACATLRVLARLVDHRNDSYFSGGQAVGDEVGVVRDNNFAGSGATTGVTQHGKIAQVLRNL